MYCVPLDFELGPLSASHRRDPTKSNKPVQSTEQQATRQRGPRTRRVSLVKARPPCASIPGRRRPGPFIGGPCLRDTLAGNDPGGPTGPSGRPTAHAEAQIAGATAASPALTWAAQISRRRERGLLLGRSIAHPGGEDDGRDRHPRHGGNHLPGFLLRRRWSSVVPQKNRSSSSTEPVRTSTV